MANQSFQSPRRGRNTSILKNFQDSSSGRSGVKFTFSEIRSKPRTDDTEVKGPRALGVSHSLPFENYVQVSQKASHVLVMRSFMRKRESNIEEEKKETILKYCTPAK